MTYGGAAGNTAEQIRHAINQWVEEQTAGLIRDLLPPGSLSPISRLVLVNAIYFKASWASPFDPLKTRDRPFTLLDGGQVEVPTMHGEMHGRYATDRDFQAVELPYYGGQAAMLIVMPDEGRFEAVGESLSAAGMRSIDDQLRPDKLEISLPKFRILMSKKLRTLLYAMGMEDAFDASLADFARMVDPEKGSLVIDEVYHKAFVEVNEEGTEAAAAAAVVLEWISTYRPEPQVVTIDRPFLFFVRDVETGAILFMGRVLDPSGEGG
jgi:serpin B